jgi:hypothetical protein
LAKRLLQVGSLSSIASKPLWSATSLVAVSIKSCAFMVAQFMPETVAFESEETNGVNTP